MSRVYVFLIHGVGKQPEGTWHQCWRDSMIASLRRYAPYAEQTPEQIERSVLRFVPISYDRIFEEYRNRWGGLAGALAESDALGSDDLKQALRWIERTDEDAVREAFWGSALDAVLWYGLPQARAAVMAKVIEQTVEHVGQMRDENHGVDRAHWVAHSLGTSVLHDSLVSLRYARNIHQGAFDPENLKWQSVCMVANTSRLLRARKSVSPGVDVAQLHPYRSVLRPSGEGAIVRGYYNFHHRLDPIAWARQFHPLHFSTGYQDIELQHFKNPLCIHDMVHYLESPLVHLRMLRTILGNEQLGTFDEISSTAHDYLQRYPNTVGDPFAEVRNLMKDAADTPPSVSTIAEFLSRAFAQTKGAC